MGRKSGLRKANKANATATTTSLDDGCQLAAVREDSTPREDEASIDLTGCEQPSRGQELLEMLKNNADATVKRSLAMEKPSKAKPTREATAEDQQVQVTVRRTFIELVDSERTHRRRGGRDRAFTDSDLFDSDSREEAHSSCNKQKVQKWSWTKAHSKASLLGDSSDASTDEPSSGDDVAQAPVAVTPSQSGAMQEDVEEIYGQGQWQPCVTMHDDLSMQVPLGVDGMGCMEAPMQMGTWWVPMANGFEAGTAVQLVCLDPFGAQVVEAAPGDWNCQWATMACPMTGGFDGMCSDYTYDATGTASCGAEPVGETTTGASSSASAVVVEAKEAKPDSGDTPRTTVMLRNLPNSYTRSMLVELIDAEGFADKYDFVYLPVDFSSQAGLGYAFVNFLSPEDADRCQEHFEGFSRWCVESEKVCSVTWAGPHQGLAQHVERYRSSPVMHESVPDEWKPALYMAGVGRIDFPPPTQTIRKPKIRRRPDGSMTK